MNVNRSSRPSHARAITRKRLASAALTCILGTTVYAQTPDPAEAARRGGEMAHYGICSVYGCNNGSAGAGIHIGYDPCYLAQNALRPCASEQRLPSRPVGVDPLLVGTWSIPFDNGPWVLEIHADGTYKFHSEAADGAPTHAGTFSAGNGHWTLTSTSKISDAGLYLYQAPNIWIATGKLGAAAWRRAASADEAMRWCASEQRTVPSVAGVDPNLVGIWELPIKGGQWVWEIVRDGTYKFRSEAGDGAPSHSGRFVASDGHWSLTSTTGYSDSGLYLYQAPDIWMATGRLGAAAWRRPASNAALCTKNVRSH